MDIRTYIWYWPRGKQQMRAKKYFQHVAMGVVSCDKQQWEPVSLYFNTGGYEKCFISPVERNVAQYPLGGLFFSPYLSLYNDINFNFQSIFFSLSFHACLLLCAFSWKWKIFTFFFIQNIGKFMRIKRTKKSCDKSYTWSWIYGWRKAVDDEFLSLARVINSLSKEIERLFL